MQQAQAQIRNVCAKGEIGRRKPTRMVMSGTISAPTFDKIATNCKHMHK